MPVAEIDAIGQSAISELGNMIAGNAATVFANNSIIIDITTPDYCTGREYQASSKQMFCVPFASDIGELSINIFIEG